MKKASIIFSLFFLITSVALAGKKKSGKQCCKPKVEKQVNSDSIAQILALKMGDYQTAIVFSYKALAQDPNNLTELINLAKLYYKSGQFELAINSCNQIIQNDTMSIVGMELAALSFKNLKNFSAASQLYLEMHKRFSNPKYLYDLASIQFENKKYDDCLNTISAIVNAEESINKSIGMTRQNAMGQFINEEINLVAASLNMAGFVTLQQENLKNAEAYFQKALQVQPSFVLAENNLKEVQKKQASNTEKK